jgi:AcrR family transcriptional regulator
VDRVVTVPTTGEQPRERRATPAADHPIVRSAIERTLARRVEAYEDEVQRLVDATYRVIARTASVDPTVRDILAEAGMSTQAFYRHFRSKDELLVVLLDDGRRRIVDYLAHRMGKAGGPEAAVCAFVEGVMAQAADPEAAARTRPFVVQQDRLADRFAEHQQGSVTRLVELLHEPLEALGSTDVHRDAATVYLVAFASMEQHVRDRTTPTRGDVEHLVRFCLRAVQPDEATRP